MNAKVSAHREANRQNQQLVPEAWNHVRRAISHQRQNKVRYNVCVDVHLTIFLLFVVCNFIVLNIKWRSRCWYMDITVWHAQSMLGETG